MLVVGLTDAWLDASVGAENTARWLREDPHTCSEQVLEAGAEEGPGQRQTSVLVHTDTGHGEGSEPCRGCTNGEGKYRPQPLNLSPDSKRNSLSLEA